MGIRLRVVYYGDKEDVLSLLAHNTAYVERTHLTSRHLGSRLTRRTLAYSKALERHRAAAVWEDIVYNLVCPLKTLRLEVADDRSAAGLLGHRLWLQA